MFFLVLRIGRHKGQDGVRLLVGQARTLGEVAAVVLAAFAQQGLHAFDAQPVQLVDRPQHGAATRRIVDGDARHFQHAIEQLAVVELDDVAAPRQAQRFQRVAQHHQQFGIGGGIGTAHRIGIELGEFAEAAGARLLVAPHRAHRIAAERLGDGLEMRRDMARQWRGQVIAQAQPLVVVILEREDAGIGPVDIGQELAQRIGIFEGRGFQRIEAIGFINPANGLQHRPFGRDLGAAAVAESARQARLGTGGFVFAHDSICRGGTGGLYGTATPPARKR